MTKLMLTAWAAICLSGVAFSQQDSTKNNRSKVQKEQKGKDDRNNSMKSSKQKINKQKTDSVNSNMDSTTRRETR